MPYIKQEVRDIVDDDIDRVLIGFGEPNCGLLNYIITRLCHNYLRRVGVNYARLNEIMGVLSCVQQELYRRVASPYEDKKIVENGDIGMLNKKQIKEKQWLNLGKQKNKTLVHNLIICRQLV